MLDFGNVALSGMGKDAHEAGCHDDRVSRSDRRLPYNPRRCCSVSKLGRARSGTPAGNFQCMLFVGPNSTWVSKLARQNIEVAVEALDPTRGGR